MERKRKFLCGKWKYRINGGSEETRNVPFSAFCTGESECYTEFDSEIFDVKTQSVLLVFEGITYKAEVLVNGKLIGEMLPYCRYVFDVGNILKLGSNKVLVKLYDMGVVFGPSEGWENYGGIIRDVYLEYVSKARIKNFFWKTDLSKNYNSSGCSIRVELDIPSKDSAAYSIQAILRNRGAVVSSARTDLKQAKAVVNFYVDNPALWSPDAPNLYDLEVNLLLKDTVIDAVSGAVGFKELKAKGGKFYLNGEALFLRGVCRHDMWGHSGGHTLTDAQMEQDMQMIKRTGFNFVRLVHYPHNKRIVEIADRIGLLVSEEPGLWWSDLKNKEVTDAALEVLRSTIIRDRSNVSVAFWLAFNECELTAEFAAMAASVAHKNDPTRLVSGANCMNTADTKRLFTEQGFDFYTYHPYGPNPNNVSTGIGGAKEPASMAMIMKELDDKPLVFTEWGGWYPIGNHNLMNEFLDTLINAGKSNEKGKGLAGMAYWQWNDIYEANRGPPACIDGILIEGLVDVDRHPKEDLAVFSAKLAESFYEK
jgi:hypothetical protein